MSDDPELQELQNLLKAEQLENKAKYQDVDEDEKYGYHFGTFERLKHQGFLAKMLKKEGDVEIYSTGILYDGSFLHFKDVESFTSDQTKCHTSLSNLGYRRLELFGELGTKLISLGGKEVFGSLGALEALLCYHLGKRLADEKNAGRFEYGVGRKAVEIAYCRKGLRIGEQMFKWRKVGVPGQSSEQEENVLKEGGVILNSFDGLSSKNVGGLFIKGYIDLPLPNPRKGRLQYGTIYCVSDKTPNLYAHLYNIEYLAGGNVFSRERCRNMQLDKRLPNIS